MKYFFLWILLPVSVIAQESINVSPQIIAKVKINQSITVDEYKVTFVSVISDSRCPKNVTCVWPGEAEICLKIASDESSEERTFVVKATSPSEHGILLKETSRNKIYLKALKPYPETAQRIPGEQYYLEVFVQKIIE